MQAPAATAPSSVLAAAADAVMNTKTYNAPSFLAWKGQLEPALAAGVPRDKLGAGLGCWVESGAVPPWNLSPTSAAERVCELMNQSFQEIDMFR